MEEEYVSDEKLSEFQDSVKNFFSTKNVVWHDQNDGCTYRYNIPMYEMSIEEAIEAMVPGVNYVDNPNLNMTIHNGYIYYE